MMASLEYDLLRTEWIVYKCHNYTHYPQNLYAALCNNKFIKDKEEWSCSWRHSGAIVAELVGIGDYMDWYCSGMSTNQSSYCVEEGVVTPEIRTDLLNLGWTYKHYEPRFKPGFYTNDWGKFTG